MQEALASGYHEDTLHYEYPDYTMIWPYRDALYNKSDISVFEYLIRQGLSVQEADVCAATYSDRVDVLELFHKNGSTFNEMTIVMAVGEANKLETLQYLMRKGCPVDLTPIDFQQAYERDDNDDGCYTGYRSMEIAVYWGRIDQIKQLRTVLYPFVPKTFEVALSGQDSSIDLLQYLKEEASGDPFCGQYIQLCKGSWYNDVEACFLEDKIVDNMSIGYDIAVDRDDRALVALLARYKIPFPEGLANAALRGPGLDSAKYLASEYNVMPTSDAYSCVLRTPPAEEELLGKLNWLYEDLGIRVNPEGLTNLANHSTAVQRWFHDRCRSCRVNFKNGNSGVKRKAS